MGTGYQARSHGPAHHPGRRLRGRREPDLGHQRGESFPDALAVGPSTFIEGPLLFVKLDSIPSQTRSVLSALQPCYIHVVGGDKVVNDKVFQQLKAYANPTLCEAPAP